jgi:hypothetical protein
MVTIRSNTIRNNRADSALGGPHQKQFDHNVSRFQLVSDSASTAEIARKQNQPLGSFTLFKSSL